MPTTVPEIPVVPVVPTTPTTPSEFVAANSGSAGQVYSANNIAQTTTAPVAAPNLSDPFGLYNYYMNTPDITAAKESAKTAQAQLLERTKAAREQQQALGQNLQSTNRIRGSQQNAQQLATNDIQALNEAYTLAASNVDALTSTAKEKMAIAEQSRNEIKQMIAATGGKAGISYADTYESAVKKAKKYEDKVAKEAKKDAEKSALKDMALAAGVSTKGKSSKDIRKALEKAAKKDKSIKDQLDQLKIQQAKADISKTLKGDKVTEQQIDTTDKGVQDLLQQAVNSGDDWETIATNLQGKINLNPGSLADRYLRYRFLGEDGNNEFTPK